LPHARESSQEKRIGEGPSKQVCSVLQAHERYGGGQASRLVHGQQEAQETHVDGSVGVDVFSGSQFFLLALNQGVCHTCCQQTTEGVVLETHCNALLRHKVVVSTSRRRHLITAIKTLALMTVCSPIEDSWQPLCSNAIIVQNEMKLFLTYQNQNVLAF